MRAVTLTLTIYWTSADKRRGSTCGGGGGQGHEAGRFAPAHLPLAHLHPVFEIRQTKFYFQPVWAREVNKATAE